ncbi:hypothetical protein GYMLUDRAFT_699785 [Collybiopsis luxurians FD-317 M1]|uniref:Uncharacterized protein n=1 Tax=Collybiopsis luxurians FD-317 M1 TaxID=944289 RepID=A0A0D0BS96_9AGAR|nr:hypothetical protein GYMLUDRAFT_699785 [Collybiopsis luxurians FD-317 M1]
MFSEAKFKFKMRNPFSRKKQKDNIPKEIIESGIAIQNTQSARDSVSNASMHSGLINGNALSISSDDPLTNKEPSTERLALQFAGAAVEEALRTLKDLAAFIPVPGLGPALGLVCNWIDKYHKVLRNKKQFADLLKELSTGATEVKEYQKQSSSTETDEIFQTLAKYNYILISRNI